MGTFPGLEWTVPTLTALLFKITVLLGVGWLAHWGMKSMNPRWRVLLWRSVICGIVAIPLLSFVTPSVPIKVSKLPPIGLSEFPYFNPQATVEAPTEPAHVEPNPVQPNAISSTIPVFPAEKQYETSAPSWNATRLLFILWGIVAAGCAIGFLPSLIGMNRIKKSARRVPDSMQEVFDRVRLDFQCRRNVHLRCSPHLATPILYGFLSSTVFVPEFMTKSGYKKEWEAVFAHELAHHRGKDAGWEAIIRLLQTLLWFHPLIWRIRDAHSAACEQVCDATAARYVGDFDAYSKTLARAALDLHQIRSRSGGIAMVRQAKIHNRLEALKQKIIDLPFTRTRLTLFGCIVCFFFFGLTALNIVEELGAAESNSAKSNNEFNMFPGVVQPINTDSITMRKLPEGYLPFVHSFPTLDGKYVAGVDRSTGNLIFKNLMTGEIKILKEASGKEPFSNAVACRIDPDNETIAYSWYDGKSEKCELRLIQMNGSNDRLLYKGNQSDWIDLLSFTADQKLFFVSHSVNTVDCIILSTTDGSKEVLFTIPNTKGYAHTALLSPDQNYIAYEIGTRPSVSRDIFLYSIKDKKEYNLVYHPADDRLVGWSPDGKWILFTSDRLGVDGGLWGVKIGSNPENEQPVLLRFGIKNSDSNCVWPDGSLYFLKSDIFSDVFITAMDLNTGEFLEPIVRVGDSLKSPRKDWGTFSPSGEKIVFTYKDINFTNGHDAVYSIKNKTTTSIPYDGLYEGNIVVWMDEVNGIGNWTDYSHLNIWPLGYTLYKVNTITGEKKMIVPGSKDVRLWPLDFNKETNDLFYSRSPKDSPNTQIIAYNTDTGEENVLSEVTFDQQLPFLILLSPDRKWVVYWEREWWKLWDDKLKVISLETKESREVYTIPKRDGTTIALMRWMPDSQSILVLLNDSNPKGKSLWRVPINNDPPMQIWRTEDLDINYFNLHSDGRHITFTMTQSISETWVMENFLPKE